MISPLADAGGDQSFCLVAKRFSQQMIVAWDFSNTRPAARTPMPSVLIFTARETISGGVRSRAIGLPVRSLERLLQLLHK